MSRYRIMLVLLLAVLCMQSRSAHAQIPGPLLPPGAAEVGATYERVDRNLEYENKKDEYETAGAIASFRLGLTETLTVAAEVGGGLGSSTGDAVSYIIGAHIQTRMWQHNTLAVTTSIAYKRSLNLAGSAPGADIDEQRLDWNVLVQQPVSIHTQKIMLWAGPTISYLYATPQSPFEEDSRESSQLLGGIVGMGVVLVQHVVVNAQATWINRAEPTISLSYRF